MPVLTRIWLPLKAEDALQCRGANGQYCSNYIRSGDVFSVDDWHAQYLADKNMWYNATSTRCFRCTVVHIMQEVISNSLDPAHTTFSQKFKDGLAQLCKLPVREELHKIIREECADPDGPLSPGP